MFSASSSPKTSAISSSALAQNRVVMMFGLPAGSVVERNATDSKLYPQQENSSIGTAHCAQTSLEVKRLLMRVIRVPQVAIAGKHQAQCLGVRSDRHPKETS